ncbi:FecR family protein [Mucilaginibacter segetis]|uniref:FecR family protein n=1 Tax=Mucilaginibacter segetis TaxID=2793071 RepID=A0A934ULK1_9SPHI|nr:FecR family protein [Mucilaginibacter segetis]MBK0377961.1 FecR family protein [Mucilaginibacter segetis]
MKEPISVELLEKYLSGNCTAAETALVKKWYQSFEQVPDPVDTLNASEQELLKEKIYSAILSEIESANNKEERILVTGKPKMQTWYRWAAAAVAFIAVAGLFYFSTSKTSHTDSLKGTTDVVAITNNSDHIYKSILPDSSAVWLSPHARLTYPKVFGEKARMVSMAGECFFEVTKNPERPFIITSRSIITKVWGTSFLVRDNDKSTTADVSVVTGKVSVSIKSKNKVADDLLTVNKDEVMLYPSQKAVYLKDKHVLKPFETKGADAELKIWKHVNLNFDNKPLKDIVPVLNATFNVQIKVTDEKLNHYLLNADFSGLNLPDVLEALSKALNIDYAIKNNSIELNKPIN